MEGRKKSTSSSSADMDETSEIVPPIEIGCSSLELVRPDWTRVSVGVTAGGVSRLKGRRSRSLVVDGIQSSVVQDSSSWARQRRDRKSVV